MWYLLNTAGQRIYLKPNQELTFGRKRSDILLQNDESISRIHASIHLQPKQIAQIGEPISICTVKDMGSKYGTYIIVKGTDQIEVQKEGYNLKHGDVVKFGLQDHTFKVVYVPIIAVVSTLSDIDKEKLQDLMNEIDGLISTDWIKICTHLTVSRASLTEKVAWAMASIVPIVTLSYWERVKHAVHNGEELPDANDFAPPISESLVINGKVSLRQNEKRKTLFRNLLFVHFSVRQYNHYGRMIRMAGGKSILYSKNPLTHEELCAPNVIVLQCSDSDTTQSTQHFAAEYDSIYKALQDSKRQVISETDIPLAILQCSVDKYCNPNFKFGNLLKRSRLKTDSSKVLVLDTQDATADVRILPKVVSNVPLKSENVANAKRKIEIIPESYDTCNSSGFLGNDSISQFREGLISSTPKNSLGTGDSLNRDIAVAKEGVPNVKEVCSKKTTAYIPETIYSRVSDASQKDTQRSTQERPSSREQNTNTQDSEQLKESMIAEKGTLPNEVIDITVETDDESKSIHSDVSNLDANLNKIFTKDKPSLFSLDINNVRGRSPEKESKRLPGKGNIPAPRKDQNLLKLTTFEAEENETRSRKRNKNCIPSQSDEEFMTSARKRVCSQNLGVENTMRSSENEKQGTTVTTVNHSNSSNLTGFTSFFLRKNLSGKTFKKIYNMIPEKRISLEDMYVWNARNIQNF